MKYDEAMIETNMGRSFPPTVPMSCIQTMEMTSHALQFKFQSPLLDNLFGNSECFVFFVTRVVNLHHCFGSAAVVVSKK